MKRIVGVLTAAAVTAAACSAPSREVARPDLARPTPAPATATTRPTTPPDAASPADTTPSTPATARRREPPAPTLPRVVLVRSVGAFPPEVLEALERAGGADDAVAVRSGAVLLHRSRDAAGRVVDALPPGWGIPLDVLALDPVAYARLLPRRSRRVLARLRPGRALLGATSARLRGLGSGATLDLGGRELRVAGVVDDRVIGSAEVVVTPADADGIGVGGVRYVLLGAKVPLAGAVDAVLDGQSGVLSRRLGEAPWQRSWREVLPQAVVKERFGEFAIRPGSGRTMDQEPGWAGDHISAATVPVLGEVRCHRAMLPQLRRAMSELQRRGLGHHVDRADYAGCFSPRLIAPGASVSRHAWGLAVDLNASTNPFGSRGTQHPSLVRIMERHGFGYGGRWPEPDPMHFEYRGRPAP